jgi:hypothetical protein
MKSSAYCHPPLDWHAGPQSCEDTAYSSADAAQGIGLANRALQLLAALSCSVRVLSQSEKTVLMLGGGVEEIPWLTSTDICTIMSAPRPVSIVLVGDSLMRHAMQVRVGGLTHQGTFHFTALKAGARYFMI